MNPQTSLTLLTFTGLVVGSVGGLISQLTKTSVDVDGTTRKRLTGAGRWALVISLMGFAGSFGSEILKASVKAQEQGQAKLDAMLRDQKETENKEWQRRSDDWQASSDKLQHDIKTDTTTALGLSEVHLQKTIDGFKQEQAGILGTRKDIAGSRETTVKVGKASSLLTSMTIRLVIQQAPAQLLEQLRNGQKNAGTQRARFEKEAETDFQLQHLGTDDFDEYERLEIYQRIIQPFIHLIAADRFSKEEGLLGIGLDNRYSVLACFGWVTHPEIMLMNGQTTFLPSGVRIGDEILWVPSWVRKENYTRAKGHSPKISLEVNRDSIVLVAVVDLASFDDSLLRYVRDSAVTAALPDDLAFFSWAASNAGELSEQDRAQLQLPFDSKSLHPAFLDVDSKKDVSFKDRTPSWLDTNDSEWKTKNAGWIKSNSTWVEQSPSWMRHMRLQIIPNGVDGISKTYDLTLSSAGYPNEGDEESEPRGYVRIWHGHALK